MFTVLGGACVWAAVRLIGSGYLLRLYDQGKFGLYALVGVSMIFIVGFVLGFWCVLLTEVLGFRPRKMYHYEGWPDGPTISIRLRG